MQNQVYPYSRSSVKLYTVQSHIQWNMRPEWGDTMPCNTRPSKMPKPLAVYMCTCVPTSGAEEAFSDWSGH